MSDSLRRLRASEAMDPPGERAQPAGSVNRQARPALMLSFEFKDGKRRAFSYAHLYDVHFDPQGTIELTFSDHLVRLTGVGLEALFDAILRHVQTEIVEADPFHAQAMGAEAVVTRIEVQDRRPAFGESSIE